MTVLSRRTDESVVIGDQYTVTVLTIDGTRVELLISIDKTKTLAETTAWLEVGQVMTLGNGITIAIRRAENQKAELGIDAPVDVPVHRKEKEDVLRPFNSPLFITAAVDQKIKIGTHLHLEPTDIDSTGVRVLIKGELVGGADDGKVLNEARELGPGSNLLLGTQIVVTLVRVAGTLAHFSVVRPMHMKIEIS